MLQFKFKPIPTGIFYKKQISTCKASGRELELKVKHLFAFGLGNLCHLPMKFRLSVDLVKIKVSTLSEWVLIPANSQSFDSPVQRATPGEVLPTWLGLHTALFSPTSIHWDAWVPGTTAETLQNVYKENGKCRLLLRSQ